MTILPSRIKPTRSKPTPASVSLDPLARSQLAWIKATLKDANPSNSVIVRRALALYVSHLERELDDGPNWAELNRLDHHKEGNAVPWRVEPDFSAAPGKKFSEFIRECQKRFDPEKFSRTPTSLERRAAEVLRDVVVDGKTYTPNARPSIDYVSDCPTAQSIRAERKLSRQPVTTTTQSHT